MKVLALSVLLALVSGFASSAQAQSCAMPMEAWGEPWPDELSVPGVDVEDRTHISLKRADGVAIRCALATSLRSRRVRVLPRDLRARVRRMRVGPLWLDQGHPRIGSFWLQHTADGTLELSDTLVMHQHVRFGLVVHVAKRHGRWVVTQFSPRISHARRR